VNSHTCSRLTYNHRKSRLLLEPREILQYYSKWILKEVNMCFTARDQPPPSDVIDTPPPRHRSITFSDAAMLTTERQSLGTVVLQSKQKTPSTQQHNLKKANTTTGTSDSKPKTSFKPMRIDIKGCQQLEPVFEDQNSLMPRKPGIRHPHSPFPTKEQLAAVRSVVSTPGMFFYQHSIKNCY